MEINMNIINALASGFDVSYNNVSREIIQHLRRVKVQEGGATLMMNAPFLSEM